VRQNLSFVFQGFYEPHFQSSACSGLLRRLAPNYLRAREWKQSIFDAARHSFRHLLDMRLADDGEVIAIGKTNLEIFHCISPPRVRYGNWRACGTNQQYRAVVVLRPILAKRQHIGSISCQEPASFVYFDRSKYAGRAELSEQSRLKIRAPCAATRTAVSNASRASRRAGGFTPG
jgi:hypothetical protein